MTHAATVFSHHFHSTTRHFRTTLTFNYSRHSIYSSCYFRNRNLEGFFVATCHANYATEANETTQTHPDEVRRLLKDSYTKHGTINLEKRTRVTEFFQMYNKMRRMPPWNELASLSQDLQLNIRQIYRVYEEEASKGKLDKYIKGTRGKITFRTKQLIRQWLRQTNYKMPDENEKMYLSQVCDISLEQLRGQLRRLMDPKGKITDAARRMVRVWYEKNGQMHPNKAQMEELRHLTGLSTFQLREQFRHINVKHGIVTHEKKQLIAQFWKDCEYQMPSLERIRAVALRTKLSTQQVYGQLYQLRHGVENASVEPQHKKTIFEYADEHHQDSSTTEMTDELGKLTNLSRAQIMGQLRLWREVQGPVNAQTKSVLKQWLEANNHRSPTSEERQELMKQTSWSSSQLARRLFEMRETSGDITDESERIIHEWIQLHKRKPKGVEVRQLSDKTHLSRVQIYYLVRKLMDPPGQVTEDTKQVVWQWLLDNDSAKPNKEQKASLLEKTGWNQEQLLYQMRQMRQKL